MSSTILERLPSLLLFPTHHSCLHKDEIHQCRSHSHALIHMQPYWLCSPQEFYHGSTNLVASIILLVFGFTHLKKDFLCFRIHNLPQSLNQTQVHFHVGRVCRIKSHHVRPVGPIPFAPTKTFCHQSIHISTRQGGQPQKSSIESSIVPPNHVRLITREWKAPFHQWQQTLGRLKLTYKDCLRVMHHFFRRSSVFW